MLALTAADWSSGKENVQSSSYRGALLSGAPVLSDEWGQAGRSRDEEELDKGTGATDGAEGQSNLAQPPLSLLDLPDETIQQVYEALLSLLQRVPTLAVDAPATLALPLDSILVNKRVCRIALPVWWRRLHLTEKHTVSFNLERYTHLTRNVHEFVLQSSPCPGWLSQLWRFPSLLMALLPHLNDVSLFGTVPHLPDRFSLQENLPQVRALSLNTARSGNVLISRSASTVKRSRVTDPFPGRCAIPWRTAEEVHLAPSKGQFQDWQRFIDAVKEATEPSAGFAIRSLILEVKHLSLNRSPLADHYYPQQTTGIVFSTVTTLALTEHHITPHQHSYSSLPSFLAMFPSLETFHLIGCDLFHPFNRKELSIPSSSSPSSFPLPSLDVLRTRAMQLTKPINLLEKTKVRHFRYRVDGRAEVQMRWTREEENGEFSGEWWWLCAA
ncbi:hypothetical protein JCM8547_004075 [Rhodosporidiobolus lusitaniae]